MSIRKQILSSLFLSRRSLSNSLDHETLDLVLEGANLVHEVGGLVGGDGAGDDCTGDATGSAEGGLAVLQEKV